MNRAVQYLWLQTPLRVSRRWPMLGIAIADGNYVMRWPLVAVVAAPAATVVGALMAVILAGLTGPYDLVIYTTNVIVMALFVMLGQLSGAAGVWCTVGYTLVSAAINLVSGQSLDALFVIGLLAGSAQVMIVLLVAVALIPLLVGGTRSYVRRLPRGASQWLEPIAAGAVAAISLWAWCSVAPLLIRPLFVWTVGAPTYEAVAPLQEQGGLVMVAGAGAALGRVFIERVALRGETAWFSQVLAAGFATAGSQRSSRGLGGALGAVLSSAGIAFFLSGVISHWVEAIAVFVFFVCVFLAQNFLRGSSLVLFRWFLRIPLVVRLLLALVITWLVCQVTVGLLWNSTESFFPVLAASCISSAVILLATTGANVAARDHSSESA
ncbi:MAG: hypothetical protein ACRCSP_00540 [Rhodoglobus sp.]